MSKSQHARKPRPVTVSVTQPEYDWPNGWFAKPVRVGTYTLTWIERPSLRKDEAMVDGYSGPRPASKQGPRPVQGKRTAIHEGLMDLMDVQDEQAIADDEFDIMSESMMNVLSAKLEPEYRDQDGLVWTSATPKHLAVVIDMSARAKAKHRAEVEAQMAQGVRFRDLDPYTLEPYSKTVRPGGYIKASTTAKTRRAPVA